MSQAPAIACTLTPTAYEDRIAWIGALTRDALRGHERRDLVLHLRYAPEARDRVREMVKNEQTCCSFLKFDVDEGPDEIQITITVSETAREAADVLFEEFVAGRSTKRPLGTKAAAATAVTVATGAVACGACCVLPFAMPAAALAATGGALAWLASVHAIVTVSAVLAVVGAWSWIGYETFRTGLRPATSTLYVMTAATGLLAVAMLWPVIEPQLISVLRV